MPLDFSGKNLRGRSFKGQNLKGANFIGADIRSTDFTDANLTLANFSHAKAGLQHRWAIFLVVVSLLLSGLSGLFFSFIGYVLLSIPLYLSKDNTPEYISFLTAEFFIIIIFAIFIFITIRKGIQVGLGTVAVIGIAVPAFVGAFTISINGAFITTAALIVAFAVAIASTGTFAAAIAFTEARVVAGAKAFAFAVVVAVAFAVAGVFSFAYFGAFAEPNPGDVAVPEASARVGVFIIVFAGAGAVTGVPVLLSVYSSCQAFKGDEKHALIRNIAVAFAATGGTSFRNVNLSDANFTGATLKSTDFRKATLTRF
ncbi:pentapeptide repeat-containing protein [Nostoc sp. CHAB 5715]|uniref:pentapeptide repeat-containing protein n=1 Tax=Nostoc sp. CHAB 5715 TaxID=2780400 RepID=UPI001E357CF7|nr:pentapeptide repeat-containing protein [Nostoc sp. CHAB 5715]MCC5622225.1 pentapeptide repeat-containing protein [Nostoc sp. CHAB 5715]